MNVEKYIFQHKNIYNVSWVAISSLKAYDSTQNMLC